jgi:hypothetical protein
MYEETAPRKLKKSLYMHVPDVFYTRVAVGI